MNREIVRKAGGLCLSQKDNDLFEYLCSTISEKVMERKPIYEKMIMDFSILIARLIHDSILLELPQVFEKMAEIVERYWFYSSHQEEDLDLSFSYIRIYQNINMLKVYMANNKRESTIHDDAIIIEKQSKQVQAIKAIHDNPGSTHGEICEKIGTSKSNLSQRISSLIEQNYINVNKIGKYNYYSLSNKGLELYKLLCVRNKKRSELPYWTKSHVKALSLLLQIATEAYDSLSVIDATTIMRLIKQLSRYDEEKIEEVLSDINKTTKYKDGNLELAGFEGIRDYQQKNIIMNEVLSLKRMRERINERPFISSYLIKDNSIPFELLSSQERLQNNRLMIKGMEYVK